MRTNNIITGQEVSREKQGRARELRREMTPAERRLWNRLRANRLAGWHFRRQQIIDGFIQVLETIVDKLKTSPPSLEGRG